VIETTRGRRGRKVRRFTLGEEMTPPGYRAFDFAQPQGHGAS
jgi:hypothetical protein